jgi:hypothetical protein
MSSRIGLRRNIPWERAPTPETRGAGAPAPTCLRHTAVREGRFVMSYGDDAGIECACRAPESDGR